MALCKSRVLAIKFQVTTNSELEPSDLELILLLNQYCQHNFKIISSSISPQYNISSSVTNVEREMICLQFQLNSKNYKTSISGHYKVTDPFFTFLSTTNKFGQNICGNCFQAMNNKQFSTIILERKKIHKVNPTVIPTFCL